MSRPFRPVALALVAATLSLTGCKTSTPYTAMYSPRKSYYVPPPEKKERSAESLLDATAPAPGAGAPGLPTAPAPVPSGLPEPAAIPGLPPTAPAPAPAGNAPSF